LHSRLSKIIAFNANQTPVYNFLLVINSNLSPKTRTISEQKATYWLKITNFPHPLSFNALAQGDPCGICGQALQILKLEFFRQPTVKIW